MGTEGQDVPEVAPAAVEKPAVTGRPNDLVAGAVPGNSTFAERAKAVPAKDAEEKAIQSAENKAVAPQKASRKRK